MNKEVETLEKLARNGKWLSAIGFVVATATMGVSLVALFSDKDGFERLNLPEASEKIHYLENRVSSLEVNLNSAIDSISSSIESYERGEFSTDETQVFKKLEIDLAKLNSSVDELKIIINDSPETIIENALLREKLQDTERELARIEDANVKSIDRLYSIISWSFGGLFVALLLQLLGPFFASSKSKIKEEEQ